MPDYQNLFTKVQVRGVPDEGVPVVDTGWKRQLKPGFSYWFGKLGDAVTGAS